MKFKGQNLEVGDFVAIQAKSLPIPEVRAVVIDVKDGVLDVMSTLLVPFDHKGLFPEKDVVRIKVAYPASVAIQRESRGLFSKDQRVSAVVRGKTEYGKVIAAFDGIVSILRNDGEHITGGANYFSPV